MELVLQWVISLIVFVPILLILVLIHEAGHYFTAKFLGIKVEEFGFGLPPRAWGKKIGETIYSINWLPLGGFVKLYGEDEAGSGAVRKPSQTPTKDLQRAFFSRSPWQRAAVVFAGVLMNALLAFVIYYIFLALSGYRTELPLIGDHHFFGVQEERRIAPIVTEIVKGSPAEKSGMRDLSKIVSVDTHPITTTAQFQKYVIDHKGQVLHVVLQDSKTNKSYTIAVTPRVNPPKGQGPLGVGFGAESVVLTYQTPVQKLFSGIVHPLNLMAYNLDAIKTLITVSVQEKNPGIAGEAVSGPVGIVSLVKQIISLPLKETILQLLNLAGILSISLAFFNVLPIPALDGGRLFFILVEAVTGKKIDPKIEGYIHSAGMAVLLIFILLVTFKDVFQLFR